MKVALYARTSTIDRGQNPEVQLKELREYVSHREWEVINEYIDCISGVKSKRPELDQLLKDLRRGKFHAVVVVRLDRLGRSLKHLITLLNEFQERNISLISLKEGIDFGTSTGRLMFHIIASLAEFERDLIRERVKAGLQYARSKGVRIGRPSSNVNVEAVYALREEGMSMRAISRQLGISPAHICRLLKNHVVS